MSVPLDRLYNFLHDVCNHHDLVIYGFFPHGSRKITDITPLGKSNDLSDTYLEKYQNLISRKNIFVHDQEPLNFDLYSSQDVFESLYPNFQLMSDQDD